MAGVAVHKVNQKTSAPTCFLFDRATKHKLIVQTVTAQKRLVNALTVQVDRPEKHISGNATNRELTARNATEPSDSFSTRWEVLA